MDQAQTSRRQHRFGQPGDAADHIEADRDLALQGLQLGNQSRDGRGRIVELAVDPDLALVVDDADPVHFFGDVDADRDAHDRSPLPWFFRHPLVAGVALHRLNVGAGRVFFLGNGGSFDNARLMASRCRAHRIAAKVPGHPDDYLAVAQAMIAWWRSTSAIAASSSSSVMRAGSTLSSASASLGGPRTPSASRSLLIELLHARK